MMKTIFKIKAITRLRKGNKRFSLLQGMVFLFFFTTCFAAGKAYADVRVPSVFSAHMVLQANTELVFWGWADAGETVTVQFKNKTAKTVTDTKGRWKLTIGPFAADAVPGTVEIKGKNTLTIEDVLVGEVWICGGQSNMQWEVRSSLNAEKEIAAANNSLIRHFRFPSTVSQTPGEEMPVIAWEVCSPATVGNFSGVAYYFGLSLYAKLKVPIGLVNVSVGGTPVEAWMSPAVINNPAFAPVHERWKQIIETYPARKAKYDKDLEEWKKQAADSVNGKTLPKKPVAPIGPGHRTAPTVLYNGMIAPLLSLRFKGIIWYQGEANAVRWETYDTLFKTLIRQWRSDFNYADAPFYFVQLANFKAPLPEKKNYAWIREAQSKGLSLPYTGMALAIDIGEPGNIHFKNKQEAGRRLALIALHKLYGFKDEFSGPVLQSNAVKGNTIVLNFSHADGLALRNKGEGIAFEIAGKDKVFYPATASLTSDGKLIVSSPEVKKPVALRYAWDNVPDIILYNSAGLPAAPFRTDNWSAY